MHEREPEIQPPQPPEIRRRIRLNRRQVLGLLVLAAISAFAVFGLFEAWTTEVARSDAFQVRVRYAKRYRYKEMNPLDVYVTNTSSQVIDTVTVVFESAFVLWFASVSFTPSPAEAFEIELAGLRPDETRLVRAELESERYGRHDGEISVSDGAADTVRVRLSTVILP